VPLSDHDGDLFVTMRLFLFDSTFITEFKVVNNLPNILLENLKIELKHSGEVFEVTHIIPAKTIAAGGSAESFVGLRKSEECEDLLAEEKFSAVAKFTVKEAKGTSYQDEFSL
jgi:hypothetical protein